MNQDFLPPYLMISVVFSPTGGVVIRAQLRHENLVKTAHPRLRFKETNGVDDTVPEKRRLENLSKYSHFFSILLYYEYAIWLFKCSQFILCNGCLL